MLREANYYVINLENVNIEKEHPYTLIFKGYIPTFGRSDKLYTFKYDGSIVYTDSVMPEKVKANFEEQLLEDYGCGILFELKDVRRQLKSKSQYRMEM